MQVKTIDRQGREKTMPERYAKILQKMGRLTYQTRDMVAEPVRAQKPVKVAEPETIEVAVTEPEFDSAGDAWTADLHVASKLKNQNGTWRKKPGAAAALASDE